MTEYNGETLTYDAIGNPLQYRGGYSMEWKDARRLSSLQTDDSDISYKYNADGVRIEKSVGTEKISYIVDGTLVLSEKHSDGKRLYFYYDPAGNVLGFEYYESENDSTPDMYYYVKNAQGDVIGIIDNTGATVVKYSYNAWGKILSVTDNDIAQINPFRYRSYYYDNETGFYYVSSRYYDSEIGRWINAYDVNCLGAEGEFVSYNLFAYCLNNPVNRTDVNGNWSLPNWAKVTIGAVATIAAVTVTVATGGAAAPVLISVAASTIGGAATSAISHRVTTGSWEGAGKAALDGAANGFMTGGLCALGGSVIGGAVRTVKNAKAGITIGKMGEFEKVAEIANTRHYGGLKEIKLVEKVFGTKAAETVGWWQNKCVVKGVMALKGAIYDCGGQLTGAYAKERALTKGYAFLYNVWVM